MEKVGNKTGCNPLKFSRERTGLILRQEAKEQVRGRSAFLQAWTMNAGIF
jgi:hypothetical protein